MNVYTLLSGVAIGNAVPSAATDGVEIPRPARARAEHGHLLIDGNAASGTRTYSLTLWGYDPQTGWRQLTAAGELDGSSAADIDETVPIYHLGDWARLYARQDGTPGGTTPSLTVRVALPTVPK